MIIRIIIMIKIMMVIMIVMMIDFNDVSQLKTATLDSLSFRTIDCYLVVLVEAMTRTDMILNS